MKRCFTYGTTHGEANIAFLVLLGDRIYRIIDQCGTGPRWADVRHRLERWQTCVCHPVRRTC